MRWLYAFIFVCSSVFAERVFAEGMVEELKASLIAAEDEPTESMPASIADKKKQVLSKEQSSQAIGSNMQALQSRLSELRRKLAVVSERAFLLQQNNAPVEAYSKLVEYAKLLRKEIGEVERRWRELASSEELTEQQAMWHLPDTTLSQLVIDFGSQDYVYVIPQEIAEMKLSIVAGFSVPKESWEEIFEWILAQQGVGIRDLNPFCRQLYILTDEPAGIAAITSREDDLILYPPHQRICFVLKPEGIDARSVVAMMQRFTNPKQTQLKPFGGRLAIVGRSVDVLQLIKLYKFMSQELMGKTFKIVGLSKVNASDMEEMVKTIFGSNETLSANGGERKWETDHVGLQVSSFQVYGQGESLFLVGTTEEVEKAYELVKSIERDIEDAQGKRMFWYTCRHADPNEVGLVLSKVYQLLLSQNIEEGTSAAAAAAATTGTATPDINAETGVGALVVDPGLAQPQPTATDSSSTTLNPNFVVDAKSGALIMVVEPAHLPKLEELLYKLDSPKKMVQVEFILFEKKITDSNEFGIESLKMGSSASHDQSSGLQYSGSQGSVAETGTGLLNFFLHHNKKGNMPAFDLSYNFLISQENIQVNANPSVITVNGTPATVNIVDERSINTGVNSSSTGDVVKDSFQRAQYGISIKVTPNVHVRMDPDDPLYVTLETELNFDASQGTGDRPTVSRRSVKNTVRIPDGQSVILGGLKQKNLTDSHDSLPFVGEIPGIGKLFRYSYMSDTATEMFIFITPKVIDDPEGDLEQIKKEQLAKRPGDLPGYLRAVEEAKRNEKARLFERGIEAMFGRFYTDRQSLDVRVSGEYDGK